MTSLAWILTVCLAQPGDITGDVKVVTAYQFKQNPQPALAAFQRLVAAKAVQWPMKQADVIDTIEKAKDPQAKPLLDFKVRSFSTSLFQNACRLSPQSSDAQQNWITSNKGIYCYALFIADMLDSYGDIVFDQTVSLSEVEYPFENTNLHLSQLRFAINKVGPKFPDYENYLTTIKQFYNPLPLNTEAGTARLLRGQSMRSIAGSLRKLAAPNLK